MSTTAETSVGRQGWLNRLLSKERRVPKIPEGMCVYAVGDIHGRMDLLVKVLAQIRTHAATVGKKNCIVFLGDYVDRGPQSKDVIEHLGHLAWTGWEMVYLRGNHDQAILDFLEDPSFYRAWREFGAAETLLSYGVRPPRFDDDEAFAEARNDFAAKCPPEHLQFLNTLEYYRVVGDYMFVHAGVRPGIALDRQSPQDLMWIREEFLLSDRQLDKVIVHGHTPTERPIRRSNRIGVDTGAYATGRLTSVVLTGEDCSFLAVDDRMD
jgi:diadenosine tetraphosphatase ApaH/serine/threonine PP2A family protein phosphatase